MTLILFAVVYGIVAALVFRRLTDPFRVKVTVNRILAYIMEFRLFVDEPALVWQAQRAALSANMALLRQIALPSVIMAVVFALAYGPMERTFGHGRLRVGEASVMTARTDDIPRIEGIVIETPGVRIQRSREVSWRIRAMRTQIGAIPSGVEVRYPRTGWWLLWFLVFSCGGAVLATCLPRRRSDRG